MKIRTQTTESQVVPFRNGVYKAAQKEEDETGYPKYILKRNYRICLHSAHTGSEITVKRNRRSRQREYCRFTGFRKYTMLLLRRKACHITEEDQNERNRFKDCIRKTTGNCTKYQCKRINKREAFRERAATFCAFFFHVLLISSVCFWKND